MHAESIPPRTSGAASRKQRRSKGLMYSTTVISSGQVARHLFGAGCCVAALVLLVSACAAPVLRSISEPPSSPDASEMHPDISDESIPRIDWTGIARSDKVPEAGIAQSNKVLDSNDEMYEYFHSIAKPSGVRLGFSSYFHILDFIGRTVEQVNVTYVRLANALNPRY